MQTNLAMGGFRVTGAADPTAEKDLATKSYVDDAVPTLDPVLTSIGTNFGLHANRGLYTTAVDVVAEFPLTAAGRALLDDADAAAQRITLGMATGLAADQGKIFYLDATGLLTLLAVGTVGQVLTSGGPAANPAWATVGGVPHVVFEDRNGSVAALPDTWTKRVLNTDRAQYRRFCHALGQRHYPDRRHVLRGIQRACLSGRGACRQVLSIIRTHTGQDFRHGRKLLPGSKYDNAFDRRRPCLPLPQQETFELQHQIR